MTLICDRCVATQTEENRVLSEIAHSRNRTVEDLLRRMQARRNSLSEKTERHRRERSEENRRRRAEYERRLKQYEEELSYQIMERVLEEDIDEIVERVVNDQTRNELEQRIRELKCQPEGLSGQDLEESLREYIERGDLDLEEGQIRITPRGARKLAGQILRTVFENLAKRQLGPHSLEDTGYGAERSPSSRKYEIGDEYDRIDFEKTLLNALERRPGPRKGISLDPEDLRVYEEIHQTRMVAGLIIDESGSMTGHKINAAIDTSLALSELMRREPKDLLKVYLFSQRVREIPHYDILNVSFSGGSTDIRAALQAFRKGVSNEKGDKQAYLVTDTEPNTENGRFVGFEEAAAGVVHEALEYRRAGITLNIVMLDQGLELKRLASILARKNLGRVFFASPLKLGEVIIEDYLIGKKNARAIR